MPLYNNYGRSLPNSKPYSFFDFLSTTLLFENPISMEKLQEMILRYNKTFESQSLYSISSF